ncbi:hypothetical protein [Sphingobacterium sp.]|uniref:hypothetical protein n=1 Tax=Sphingobacterium sp. TaxID=341027 RepID=UPI0028A6A7F2|nr:hypothetical protein [Sphingobacterium sp.]
MGHKGIAYADEILYAAAISPLSIAKKIPKKQIADPLKAISQVVQQGEQHILKEYPDIISSEIRGFFEGS